MDSLNGNESARQGAVTRRKVLLGGATLSLATIASACGASGSLSSAKSSRSSSTLPTTTIRVGFNSSLTAGGVVAVGTHFGWFKEAGINLVGVPFTSFPAQQAALVGGSIDVAVPGMNPAVNTLVPIAKIASLDNELDDVFLIAPSNGSISSASDLKSKRVGYVQGTVSQLLLEVALSASGMTMADIDGINLQPDGVVTAFISHQIDAASIYLPFEAAISSHEPVRVIARPTSYPGFALPMFWMIHNSLVSSNPAAVTRLLYVKARANDWRKRNLAEAARLAAKYSNAPSVVPYEQQVTAEKWLSSKQISSLYSDGTFASWLEKDESIMAKAGLVKAALPVSSMLDLSLDETALAAYFRNEPVASLR